MAHDMRDQDRLKSAVIERVADLAAEKHLGLAMILAGFDILTAPHRDLPDDPAVLALIQENYPDATQALVRNRALNEEGLRVALAAAETLARIYVDYSPLSHWASDRTSDGEKTPRMSGDVDDVLSKLSDNWMRRGASPFGVTCTIVLTAIKNAFRSGLPWPKAARICLDALHTTYVMPSSLSDSDLLAAFADTMGISESEARKYVAAANNLSRSSDGGHSQH